MAPHAPAAESRIFDGWWAVAAFVLIIFLSTGLRFSVGPFLKPGADDVGIDRGTFSLVISLSLFLHGVFVPLIGPLVDRWAPRVVGSLGTVVMVISLALTSTVHSVWEVTLRLVHQMGAALGSWLAGFLFDVSGGYGMAFTIACGLLLVGAGLSLTIDVSGRPLRRELQPVAGGR